MARGHSVALAGAAFGAVFHLVPVLRPFLAPSERTAAGGAGLLGKFRLLVCHDVSGLTRLLDGFLKRTDTVSQRYIVGRLRGLATTAFPAGRITLALRRALRFVFGKCGVNG